jgi:uncharacterized protein YbdZ (MbtH family)
MKAFWTDFKSFLFTVKYNFFDLLSILVITTVAQLYSLWLVLLMIPVTVFSAMMGWRVEKEKQNAQAGDGTVR